jgi:hypothetical protein
MTAVKEYAMFDLNLAATERLFDNFVRRFNEAEREILTTSYAFYDGRCGNKRLFVGWVEQVRHYFFISFIH